MDVTTRVVSRDRDFWSVTLLVEMEMEEEGGEMLDAGKRLTSLGLVLLEFTEVKPVKNLVRELVQHSPAEESEAWSLASWRRLEWSTKLF